MNLQFNAMSSSKSGMGTSDEDKKNFLTMDKTAELLITVIVAGSVRN